MSWKFSAVFLRSSSFFNQLTTTIINSNIMMLHLKMETYNTSTATKVPKFAVGILVSILRGCRSIALSVETNKYAEYHRQLKIH